MDIVSTIKGILRDSLQLGARADQLAESSPLLGSIPEFDSMAVITVLTLIEEEFDFEIADDEISADVFETVGSLAAFVDGKLAS
jgi:acyl carrier protein